MSSVAPSQLIWRLVQGAARRALIWVNLSVTAQRIRSSYAGLSPRIHHFHESLSKMMDCRAIQREDARSLSSGRALRGPVGAFARQ
jgi:hypothetical protein